MLSKSEGWFSSRIISGVLLVVVCFVAMACSRDDEPEDKPFEQGFNISISGNIEDSYEDVGIPITVTNVYMRGSQLPEDEKILSWGSALSTTIMNPTIEDSSNWILEVSDMEVFNDWDWSEDLYYRCGSFNYLIPGVEYHLRGYVKTNRGEYYTDPVVISSQDVLQEVPDPEYVIPVVFNIFPDANGRMVSESLVQEAVNWANLAYRNAFGVEGLTDTGITVELADIPGLDKPGIRYINEPLIVYYSGKPDEMFREEWRTDIEKAVNIWVAPIVMDVYDPYVVNGSAGFTYFPVFNHGEELEGCASINSNKTPFQQRFGICMSTNSFYNVLSRNTFSHELGHFLGLEHVFLEDYCEDTYEYDRLHYMDNMEECFFFRPFDEAADEWYVSTNIMDYEYSFTVGFTPEQKERMIYTLKNAPYTPWHRREK